MYSLLVTFCSFQQSMVEQSLSVSAITNKLGCMTSVNIWQICVDYDELTINEHQKKRKVAGALTNPKGISLNSYRPE